jgi:hypothetical protein
MSGADSRQGRSAYLDTHPSRCYRVALISCVMTAPAPPDARARPQSFRRASAGQHRPDYVAAPLAAGKGNPGGFQRQSVAPQGIEAFCSFGDAGLGRCCRPSGAARPAPTRRFPAYTKYRSPRVVAARLCAALGVMVQRQAVPASASARSGSCWRHAVPKGSLRRRMGNVTPMAPRSRSRVGTALRTTGHPRHGAC